MIKRHTSTCVSHGRDSDQRNVDGALQHPIAILLRPFCVSCHEPYITHGPFTIDDDKHQNQTKDCHFIFRSNSS